jgi:chromosomal replication initiator protein
MMQHSTKLWETAAETIRARVSGDGFSRWFAGVEMVSDDGESVVLSVPNPIHQFFIESNYLPLVSEAVSGAAGGLRAVTIVARQGDSEEVAAAAPSKATTKISLREKQKQAGTAAGLNARNTFETFVVGPNNQFAHGAAVAVAKSPARTYNPYFVYGGSGLGKTHLLQAIGHLAIAQQKAARVVYLSSEQFTNEFIDAIRNGTLVKFRKRYRQADILMIDDIQFLAGKERSQEEFFHTFNTLHDGHKQIVLSSDRPASEIEKLEQRLVSRFEWGMTAELQPPDMETRMAILRKKAETMQVTLEPWVVEFLADRIRNNVRRLEGALMRVATYTSLSERQPTREIIENLLRDIFQEQARRAVTIEQIQRKVAEHFDVRLADMTSKRRPANIAFPRQIAMFLSRELTGNSLCDIGDAFGGRDHGTVIHAVKLVKQKIQEDETTRTTIRMLDSQLQR